MKYLFITASRRRRKKRAPSADNPEKAGDQYVFVSLDSETKLVPSLRVGKRDATNTRFFMQDFQARLANRVQLTTDGFRPYINAVDYAFGVSVDYAMLIKTYQDTGSRYTPHTLTQIVNVLPIPVAGNAKPRLISTSHIERQNLTIRMQLRRLAWLTNAFSRKLENLKAALSLHVAWYNFCRVHTTLRVTPAMAAG